MVDGLSPATTLIPARKFCVRFWLLRPYLPAGRLVRLQRRAVAAGSAGAVFFDLVCPNSTWFWVFYK